MLNGTIVNRTLSSFHMRGHLNITLTICSLYLTDLQTAKNIFFQKKSSVHETCFYLDPAVQVDPPTPLQEDLTILETQPCREETIFCNLWKPPQTNYQTTCFNPVLTSICIELYRIQRNILNTTSSN